MSVPATERGIGDRRFTESVNWADAWVSTHGRLARTTDDLRVRHCELVVLWEEKENQL